MKKLAACVLVAALGVRVFAAFPKPDGYINDFAGVLDAGSRAALDALVRETERATTAEIAVATVTSLDGMTIEEYANGLFQDWGIGKRGSDNGVLVLVAPAEREMRIEVGYGLEAILPDGLAGEIIRTEFTPHFRDDDFPRGILQGTRRIADIVTRNQPVSAEERQRLDEAARRGDAPPEWILLPFLGVFLTIGAFAAGLAIRSKTVMPLIFGGLFGAFPIVMGLVALSLPSRLVLFAAGLGMIVWGYRKGQSKYWIDTLRQGSGTGGDGWVMGASSVGSGRSGSSDSSGGSFGGGSSGGGGASGRW